MSFFSHGVRTDKPECRRMFAIETAACGSAKTEDVVESPLSAGFQPRDESKRTVMKRIESCSEFYRERPTNRGRNQSGPSGFGPHTSVHGSTSSPKAVASGRS